MIWRSPETVDGRIIVLYVEEWKMRFKKGDVIRHFKREMLTKEQIEENGALFTYEFLGVAEHTETKEKLVLYKALYDGESIGLPVKKGDLKVLYYGSIVGTEDSVVPSNTQTVVYSFNVDAGVYIAFANVRWSSNAKGSRHIGFAEKTTEVFADMNAHYSIVAPSTDGMTFQNLAVILKYENPAHVEIRVQQFSGGDLKIRTRLSLLKVK